MPLLVDTEMPGGTGFQNISTSGNLTVPFTNGAGTLLLAFIVAGTASANSHTINAGVTYNALPMTLALSLTNLANGNGGTLAAYYLLNPGTGAHSLAFVTTLSAGNGSICAGCISFTGHDPVNPVRQSTSARGNSNSPSASLAGVLAGNIALAGVGAGTHFTAESQPLSWIVPTFDGNAFGNGASTRSSTPGSVSHGFTMAGADTWAEILLEIAAPAAADSTLGLIQPILHGGFA